MLGQCLGRRACRFAAWVIGLPVARWKKQKLAEEEEGDFKTANQKCAAEVIIAVSVRKYDVGLKMAAWQGARVTLRAYKTKNPVSAFLKTIWHGWTRPTFTCNEDKIGPLGPFTLSRCMCGQKIWLTSAPLLGEIETERSENVPVTARRPADTRTPTALEARTCSLKYSSNLENTRSSLERLCGSCGRQYPDGELRYELQ